MGLGTLFSQPPHIIGGFLAGILAPVAMLWMIISHIQRGDEIRNFAVALKDELKTIGLPNFNNAKQNNDLGKEARTITDLIDKTRRSLRQDIKNLHNVSEKTSQQVEKLNNNLSVVLRSSWVLRKR